MQNMKRNAALIALIAALGAAPAFAQSTAPGGVSPPATDDTTVPGTPDTTTTITVTPGFEAPEGFTLVPDFTTFSAAELTGVDLYGPDGTDIGEVVGVAVDSENVVERVIADIGGFLGMGQHRIALSGDEVFFYRNESGTLRAYVNADKAALEAMPEYEEPGTTR